MGIQNGITAVRGRVGGSSHIYQMSKAAASTQKLGFRKFVTIDSKAGIKRLETLVVVREDIVKRHHLHMVA